MIYSSAKSLCNFLLLAQSWLKIVVASGANFLESVVAGAEFFFSLKNSASIFTRSVGSILSCRSLSTT
jgi:hypothetical protein